jgi:hypothetical protein
VECLAVLSLGLEYATVKVEGKLLLGTGGPAFGSGVALLEEGLDVRV